MAETQSTRRLHWLLWIMLAWVGIILGRLVELQVFRHGELARLAEKQQQKTVEIQADRGSVLDRTGQPWARTIPVESVLVNPRKVRDIGVAADLLSPVLSLKRQDLVEHLSQAIDHKSGFMWVKRKVTAEEAVRVRSLNLDWVEFRTEMKRFYPQGPMGSHVVGSTGYVGDAERGNSGIEMAFDRDLAGKPGVAQVYNDVKQNPYERVVVQKPEPGSDITITIDPNLQFIAERELDKALKSSGAASGSVVVLDPRTGDVLAMANYPRFDPNVPPAPGESLHGRSNLAISTPFEPGSVFKVVTLTAALETTNLTAESLIDCGNGQIKLPGRIVHDVHRYGTLTLADVLAKSSNVGAIRIGLRVGEHRLYDYIRKFGFGQKSGIDLPGESSGLLRPVKGWTPGSIGSIAMGHEIGTTSLQLALAAVVVANGGLRVKPRLVISRQKPGGQLETFPIAEPERVLRAETAIEMRRLMEGVVLHGTGRGLANIKGYTSGGKTGSAQIFDPKTHTYAQAYNASFVGFAPVVNPQVVVAVTLNHTRAGSAGYGGPVAGPVFREVALHALRLLDVPKDLPERDTPEKSNVNQEDKLTSSDVNRNLALVSIPEAAQAVHSVTPPPVSYSSLVSASAAAEDRRPFLQDGFSQNKDRGKGSVVPDFRGMTLRSVLEEAAEQGWQIQAVGSGVARKQVPEPGIALKQRVTLRVQFEK